MNSSGPLIRDISDTALATAMIRAQENERPTAMFRDPYARRLAGVRGEQIMAAIPAGFAGRTSGPFLATTYLFDQFIQEQIQNGVDLVISLAAGLDARPYRLTLPSTLQWVEVDLPDLVDYKEEILRTEKPNCIVQRVRLDLTDVEKRRELFSSLGARAKKVLIVAQGLLVYFSPEEVASLARDLAAVPSFEFWILDLVSPGLLRIMQKNMAQQLSKTGAAFKFGPEQGPEFFSTCGWKAIDVRMPLKTAAKFKRVPLWMRMLAALPASTGKQGSRPWSGICLCAKI